MFLKKNWPLPSLLNVWLPKEDYFFNMQLLDTWITGVPASVCFTIASVFLLHYNFWFYFLSFSQNIRTQKTFEKEKTLQWILKILKENTIATVILKLPRIENRSPRKQINKQKCSSQEENKNLSPSYCLMTSETKQNNKNRRESMLITSKTPSLFKTLSAMLANVNIFL